MVIDECRKHLIVWGSSLPTVSQMRSNPLILIRQNFVGGIGVWLATDNARFLSGRFISANWSVDDLMARKDEFITANDLKIVYQGKFGLAQFDAPKA
jgi:hypothetical protein